MIYIAAIPRNKLDRGMLITSIDVDVGSTLLSRINQGRRDKDVSDHLSEYDIGRIEEFAVPLLVDFFNGIGAAVTFAIRGQLLDLDSSMVELIRDSSVRHEVASHSYYHRRFSQLSPTEADTELRLVASAMNKFSQSPKSFVFPKNDIAHLRLLRKHGYLCYRDRGGILRDGMFIRRNGPLCDVHPSLFFNKNADPRLLNRVLDVAVSKKLPLHVWFHPRDFGENEVSTLRSIRNVLLPFYSHARSRTESGLLTFETMLSAAQKVSKIERWNRCF